MARISEARAWLDQSPPRSAEAVTALTAPTARAATVAWRVSLPMLAGGIVVTTAVASSGARGAVVLLAVVGIFAIAGGALGLLLAAYRRSHANVFARLVRERALVPGVVEQCWRGPRGVEGIKVVFETEEGAKLRLTATGASFVAQCSAGQRLPCLYEPGKYAAILLPDDSLALGVWRPVRAEG